VIAVLKKVGALRPVNRAVLSLPRSRPARGSAGRAVELDEMWSFVGAKKRARWLWHALDHHSGRVLAYVEVPGRMQRL
jgi:IS1 transposase